MPKQNKIKYRESDLNEMRRMVKNFNQRRAYNIKHHPETADLQPPKMSMKEVKKSIYSRDDFNKWKKQTKSYTAETAKVKTNKYGVQATQYEIDIVKKRVQARNRRKADEQRKKDVYINGKKLKTAERVTSEQDKTPTKQGFKTAKSQKAWEEFKKAFKKMEGKRQQDEIQAYYHQLKAAFEKNVGNDEVWLLYETLGSEKIYQLYLDGLNSVDMDFVYDENIEASDKESEAQEELLKQIEITGKQRELIKKLRKYFNVDSNEELKRAWDEIGEENVFELYKNGFQINNPEEMLKQVNRFKDKKKSRKRK